MLRHAINVLADGRDLLEDALRDPQSLLRPEVRPSQCYAEGCGPDGRGFDYGRPLRDMGPSRPLRDREPPPPRRDAPRPGKQKSPNEAARITLSSTKKQDDILRDLDVLPSMDIQANTVPLKNRDQGSKGKVSQRKYSPRRQQWY